MPNANPPLTQATRELYAAIALVSHSPCRRAGDLLATTEDDLVDPLAVEQWATAELMAVHQWRYACSGLVTAARIGPATFEKERVRLISRAALHLASGPDAVPLEDGHAALAALWHATELVRDEIAPREAGRVPA